MFGFSIGKLIVLALLIAAVWYGFKWVSRLDQKRKAARKASEPEKVEGEELFECPACGTYVPATLNACPAGRADCPRLGG